MSGSGSGDNKSETHEEETQSKWTGVFEDVIYSDGPGDNIFIYG